jgi:hypothetical protein
MTEKELEKSLAFALQDAVCDLEGMVLHEVTEIVTFDEIMEERNTPADDGSFTAEQKGIRITLDNGQRFLLTIDEAPSR